MRRLEELGVDVVLGERLELPETDKLGEMKKVTTSTGKEIEYDLLVSYLDILLADVTVSDTYICSCAVRDRNQILNSCENTSPKRSTTTVSSRSVPLSRSTLIQYRLSDSVRSSTGSTRSETYVLSPRLLVSRDLS